MLEKISEPLPFPGNGASVPGRLRLKGALPPGRRTFLTRSQFQIDVESWGYRDARIPNMMTPDQVKEWTQAADQEKKT